MDYEDNDAQDQNIHLGGEGSSKVSPVLHSYRLPKFEFDDNLQEHLSFDSLVENEVFLGITSQEDNQWIEEYSRGTNTIPFNSSAPESRHQNVWSEATSSESVEMLLNSVGQEEKVIEETMIEELDANLKQRDGNDDLINTVNAVEPDEFQENFVGSKVSHATFTSQSQENSVVVANKYGLSFGVKEDDAKQEGSDLVKESIVSELSEDLSISNVESGNAGSVHNVDASFEECQENPQEVLEKIDENASDLSKNCHSSEPENLDKIGDANKEGSNLANESFVDELQDDPSASKIVCENASVEECQENPQEVLETFDENASDLSKNFHSSEPENLDKIDDANKEGSNLANESFVNELQDDPSVSKIVCENASVEECQENPQEVLEMRNENTNDLLKNHHSSEPEHIDKICDDANREGGNLENESCDNQLQEDPSFSKVDSGNAGSLKYMDASIEENENAKALSKNFHSSEGINLENESLVNKLQEYPFISKVEFGNEGSSQNVGASVEVCQENPQAPETLNENASDVFEHVDKTRDDANHEGSNLANESFVNDMQDLSVSKIGSGNEGSSHNVDASIDECQEDENASESDPPKNFHRSESEHIDKICDDSNLEGSNLKNESFVDELQEDPSVPKVECAIAGSSQNMDANIEECQENESTRDSDRSKNFYSSEPEHIAEICDDGNQEASNLGNESFVNELQEDLSVSKVEGSDVNNVGRTSIAASFSAEMPAEDISNNPPSIDTGDSKQSSPVKISNLVQLDDEIQSLEPDAVPMDQDSTFNERGDASLPLDSNDMDMDVVGAPDSQKNDEPSLSGNNAPAIHIGDSKPVKDSCLVQLDNETQPSEPNAVSMDQDFTFNERGDARLSVDFKDMDMDVAEAPDSQKNVEPSLPGEGCEEAIVMAQESEPNIIVLTDAVAAVESSKISSPDTREADTVTECQPRSPILGVSLLQDDNEEKGEVEESCQKETPEVDSRIQVVKIDAVSDGGEDVVQGLAGNGDLPVGNCDVSPSEQTADDNLGGLKCSKPLETSPLPCDSSAEEASVAAGDPSKPDTKHVVQNESSSASLDKPQIFSFSETKSIELSQSEKDKREVTKGTVENSPLLKTSNEEDRVQSISSGSSTKEEKSFTFEVTGLTDIQNMMVSSVSSSGSLLDPNKLHRDSLVSPPTPSVTPSESGAKKNSERKPRRKSVGKETAKKVNQSKETTPTRHSRTERSPALLNENQPDVNTSTSILQQSFTDNQQVQLRAQILVYGSLISGMSPEEPHMIAAFGQSDTGRQAWEAAWRGCIERVNSQKSVNTPHTPLQSRSVDKDSDQGIKIGSTKSKSIVSPMIPISSPLWNISTPQDRLLSSPTPRTALFDYRQAGTLNSYLTPRVQNLFGHNPYGQWVASSPVTAFSPRFSSLPITESVKLTTVKESGGLNIPATPVEHTANPIVSPESRKRKKVAVTSNPPTPILLSTPVSITPLTTASTHGQPRLVDQNVSKIEESKVQATEAAVHAAAAVTHCQDLWSQLKKQKSSGLASDDEAKLASSAVSIAAAASVAKVAALAAKIASNVAEQARLMAGEVFLSSKAESDKGTTPLKSDHSTSVISVAREAARRRIEAASAASKHAENLDAIVKAAELAAEAVSQAGKIVAMGNPLPISELVEAGPEGYWKTPQVSKQQGYSGNKQNVEGASSDKKIQTLKHGLSLQDDFGDLAKNENDKSIVRAPEGLDLSKTIVAVPELEIGPVHTSDADLDMPQSTSHTWKDNGIKEGCLVEVYKDDDKNKGAWFAANVVTLKDGKAFVCYTEIQSDEAQVKEWVPLEVEGTEAPKIRIPHPMTTMQFEGSRKRGRTALTDYSWCSGDQVDVWVQDSWHEAVVVERNKSDVTSLTVQFPDQGKTSVVRSWHVRPRLIWKDDKWIEWSSLKGPHSSEGDTPQEKRQKFDKEKDKSWNSVDIETKRHQESRIPTLSFKGASFDVGKTSMDDNKMNTSRTMRSGLQKERSRVVFGVPKPGKKQKFMDVSKHFVGDGSSKNNNINTSSNYSGKKIFINDSKEKQVDETTSKAPKFRKPPIPSVVRTKSSTSDKNVKDSLRVDDNLPGQHNETGVGSSLNDAPLTTPKQSSTTSKGVSQRLNKRKIPSGNVKAAKVEVKETLTTEAEPRRSNRKIQPTSRLLEGLQSSLTISKMPTISHSSQKSHKAFSKGSPRPG